MRDDRIVDFVHHGLNFFFFLRGTMVLVRSVSRSVFELAESSHIVPVASSTRWLKILSFKHWK